MDARMEAEMTDVWIATEKRSHPLWHICRKCATWGKIILVSLAINALWDFATFEPIHRFYEVMGWIK